MPKRPTAIARIMRSMVTVLSRKCRLQNDQLAAAGVADSDIRGAGGDRSGDRDRLTGGDFTLDAFGVVHVDPQLQGAFRVVADFGQHLAASGGDACPENAGAIGRFISIARGAVEGGA